jgi:acyl-CoA thioester hydrolase
MPEPTVETPRWPVTMEMPVAWGDMDALGHVNNLVYLRWFESARVTYFERLALAEDMRARRAGPILARQEIDYRRPLSYPDRVRVETGITRLGKSSFTMGFRITRADGGDLVAQGQGVVVMVDYASGKALPLGEAFMATVAALEGRAL